MRKKQNKRDKLRGPKTAIVFGREFPLGVISAGNKARKK